MLKTNRQQLVMLSVVGEISAPAVRAPYRTGFDGISRMLPGTGGICFNVAVGDPAFGWMGDHVEPGASLKLKDQNENGGLNSLACVGNSATMLTGEAKGAQGVVTGKHGGIEHVITYWKPEDLEKMSVGDRAIIRAYGAGLEIDGYPGVRCMNLSPELLDAMGVEAEADCLSVPVVAEIPAELMGSGIGAATAERGDYDITTQDRELLEQLGLDGLRLGDIVAVKDRSSFYGRSYRRGAVEIGVITHADSYLSGHGPGVTTLLTSNHGEISARIVPGANIAGYLGLREDL